jgi:AraC family L-rhamnose operon regulatory protein RhaS
LTQYCEYRITAKTQAIDDELSMKLPVFHEGNTIYSADACSPVTNAVGRGELSLHAYVRGQYPGRPLPKTDLPGLRTVGFWNTVDPQHWGLDWHRNEGIEVTFLLNGKEVYETSTGRWDLNVGDVTVCPPWQSHRIGAPNVGVGTLLWFILDTQIRRSDQHAKWPSWIVLSETDKAKLLSLLLYSSSQVFSLSEKYVQTWKKLHRILRTDSAECPVSALAITINELLYDLLEVQDTAAKSKRPKDRSRTETAVQSFFDELKAMPEQLEHPWTLREMAKLCRISPTRFSEGCRRLTNLSPLNVLNQRRVRRAETLIRDEPQKSITEIAMECGFTTSQYFATVFKKWNGQTPSEFKNDSGRPNNEDGG